MKAQEQAHRRLLNAVISLSGANRSGSQHEIQAAILELDTAKQVSQAILYGSKPAR